VPEPPFHHSARDLDGDADAINHLQELPVFVDNVGTARRVTRG
jgi:hypothetical protein